MQSASKVGALVIVFGGLLFGAYALLGRSLFEPKVNTYYALLDDAGGIAEGTKVLQAGVKVGEITSIKLKDNRALFTMKLQGDLPVRKGSTLLLPTSLIGLGDNPVQLVPPHDLAAPTLPPDNLSDPIPGVKAGALDGILPDAKDTIKELTATLTAFRKLLEDGSFKQDIQHLAKSTDASIQKFGLLADKFGKISDQGSAALAENRAAIRSTVNSTALAMADIRQSTQMLSQLLKEGKLQKGAVDLVTNLNTTVQHADNLVADLDKFLTDPKLRDPMARTMANVSDMSESGKVIAKNAEAITKNGIDISEQVAQLSHKANSMADEAHGVVTKLDSFFTKSNVKAPPMHFTMDLLHDGKPDRWRNDIEASVPFGDSTYYFGIFDAFSTNRVIAQASRPMGDKGIFRYGIYASKPGLGVQYRIAPRLGVRGDLYDINDPTLNLRLSYEVREGIVGWLGMSRVFGGNVPEIGFGVKK